MKISLYAATCSFLAFYGVAVNLKTGTRDNMVTFADAEGILGQTMAFTNSKTENANASAKSDSD